MSTSASPYTSLSGAMFWRTHRGFPVSASTNDNSRPRWIATPPMRAELARVLGYPLIARRLLRDGRRPEAVLAAFDAGSRTIDSPPPRAPFVCKDADDQMFIDLAVARRARLLSKDRAVLSMRKRLATLGVAVAPSFG